VSTDISYEKGMQMLVFIHALAEKEKLNLHIPGTVFACWYIEKLCDSVSQ